MSPDGSVVRSGPGSPRRKFPTRSAPPPQPSCDFPAPDKRTSTDRRERRSSLSVAQLGGTAIPPRVTDLLAGSLWGVWGHHSIPNRRSFSTLQAGFDDFCGMRIVLQEMVPA
jgi:hypothetical protein